MVPQLKWSLIFMTPALRSLVAPDRKVPPGFEPGYSQFAVEYLAARTQDRLLLLVGGWSGDRGGGIRTHKLQGLKLLAVPVRLRPRGAHKMDGEGFEPPKRRTTRRPFWPLPLPLGYPCRRSLWIDTRDGQGGTRTPEASNDAAALQAAPFAARVNCPFKRVSGWGGTQTPEVSL